jgi:hypothetical protein
MTWVCCLQARLLLSKVQEELKGIAPPTRKLVTSMEITLNMLIDLQDRITNECFKRPEYKDPTGKHVNLKIPTTLLKQDMIYEGLTTVRNSWTHGVTPQIRNNNQRRLC